MKEEERGKSDRLREIEKDGMKQMYTDIYIYIYIYTHISIYIEREREREQHKENL
jgi:hypothetical protein